jgi:hypothetical protein
MTGKRAASIACLAVVLDACGGGSGSPPTSPTSPPPAPTLPAGGVCGALGATPTAIVNGSSCSTASAAVVLVNVRNASNEHIGACSGTIIAPRAVLTAAHCVDGAAASVRIWLGSGEQILAQSFTKHPNYRENDLGSDVAVVLMRDDLPRAPIPLLLSRDAQMGEAAILAGWGRDENSVGVTLRAGLASITSVTPAVLQTQYSASASSVCAGDSGGALLLLEGGVWSIAAVTSANSTLFCSFGANYFASVRNRDTNVFILALVPEAARR